MLLAIFKKLPKTFFDSLTFRLQTTGKHKIKPKKWTINISNSEKDYNTKMPKTLITFQLPFGLSSGKHIFHWKAPSITAALLFQLSQTLGKFAKTALDDIQGFIIMYY